MHDDKKQQTQETGTEQEKTVASDAAPLTNESEKNEEEGNSDWVAVGSGLGIDE